MEIALLITGLIALILLYILIEKEEYKYNFDYKDNQDPFKFLNFYRKTNKELKERI
jgi:hypothetical protein